MNQFERKFCKVIQTWEKYNLNKNRRINVTNTSTVTCNFNAFKNVI